MKNVLRVAALVIAAVLVATACGLGGNDERVETLWVGPQVETCFGPFERDCLVVSESEGGDAGLFYDYIDGFDHVVGTSYVLTVAVSDVEDPPADASSVSYRLIEIVESSTAN